MILISPWSRLTTDGKPSPKNYPWWPEVVAALMRRGFEVVQLSCNGEPGVPGARRINDLALSGVATLMYGCQTWIAVDNFFPHMASCLGQPGVAIFGFSDPEIFGHPENINLLKDRKYLRQCQFRHWSQQEPDPNVFVGPDVVVSAAMVSVGNKIQRKR
jgi:hypothetical protein